MKTNVKAIGKNIQPALEVTGGAVLSSLLTKHIPLADEKIKAGIAFLAGLILMGTGKAKGTIANVATGIVAGSGLVLVKQFMPNLVAGVGASYNPMQDIISGPWANTTLSGVGGSEGGDIFNAEDLMPK